MMRNTPPVLYPALPASMGGMPVNARDHKGCPDPFAKDDTGLVGPQLRTAAS
jgi:hypothetical protein